MDGVTPSTRGNNRFGGVTQDGANASGTIVWLGVCFS
jgi:hypothetical protein